MVSQLLTVYHCKLGCGITAVNSTLTFTVNITFLKNRYNNVGVSKVGAGAILAVGSSLHFTGTNNFFDNVKSATYVTNNTVNFHGTNNFINNSAANKGGAMYTSHNSVLTFTGTSNFISNYVHGGSVRGIGGAIYTHGNASMEPTILSTTQQTMVVQSMQEPTSY